MFKLVTPLRYATTLLGIRVLFGLLMRNNRLPTASQLGYRLGRFRSDWRQQLRARKQHQQNGGGGAEGSGGIGNGGGGGGPTGLWLNLLGNQI